MLVCIKIEEYPRQEKSYDERVCSFQALTTYICSVLLVGVCLVCRRLHRPKPSTDCLDSSCVALMQIQI